MSCYYYYYYYYYYYSTALCWALADIQFHDPIRSVSQPQGRDPLPGLRLIKNEYTVPRSQKG
jgi:hypothetical protein